MSRRLVVEFAPVSQINMFGSSSDSSLPSSLLVRVSQHDPEAWRRLVHIYGPLVFRWCNLSGLSEDAAADIGQDVFQAVADGVSNFCRDRPGGTFTGWLRVITRNKIADYRRRRVKEPNVIGGSDFQSLLSMVPDFEPHDSADSNDHSENSPLFHRALQMIKTDFAETTWRAFWATVVEGRAVKDVADELNMSAMAVRKAKSRVLQRLRCEFADEKLC